MRPVELPGCPNIGALDVDSARADHGSNVIRQVTAKSSLYGKTVPDCALTMLISEVLVAPFTFMSVRKVAFVTG